MFPFRGAETPTSIQEQKKHCILDKETEHVLTFPNQIFVSQKET